MGDVNSQSRVEIIDTHCHLFLIDDEPQAVVDAARVAGVSALVCAGVDAESSRRSRELADAISGVFATAGVHPHSATDFDGTAGSAVEELLADPRVVAVGETGLDYYRMKSPAEDQRKALMHTKSGEDEDGVRAQQAGGGEEERHQDRKSVV